LAEEHAPDSAPEDRPVATVRTMEIVIAALLVIAGAVVIWDSVRVGFRWGEDGPQAGYFPFYVGVLLCGASAWTLVMAALGAAARSKGFVGARALRDIITMLVPTIVYVGLLAWLGLYVASLIYIAFFMIWLGKYGWIRSLAVSAAVSVITFLLFEVWFRVPLPKGPLEAWLGLM
jgi:putative tricarboxylic transport membrane protein